MKVKVISSKLDSYWYSDKIGQVFEVEDCKLQGWGYKLKNENSGSKYFSESDVEIIQEDIMFDLHTDSWFIRTPTPEISQAVQLWLFEQGVGWQYPVGEKIVNDTHTKFLMKSTYIKGCFCYVDGENLENDNHKEIKLTFKTTVDSVVYPETAVVETEVQKQMKALEEQIQKLIEQKDTLKEAIQKEIK